MVKRSVNVQCTVEERERGGGGIRSVTGGESELLTVNCKQPLQSWGRKKGVCECVCRERVDRPVGNGG